LEHRSLRSELQRLRSEIHARNSFEEIIAKRDRMRDIFATVAHISNVAANVLIQRRALHLLYYTSLV
jgi:transcriptional regulator with PAS, ATPase and Fis domain